jgi:hypothetical protein
MLHTLHCDVEVEYGARYNSLVLRIYLPSISYSASDAWYVLSDNRLHSNESERAEDARGWASIS